MKVLDGIRLFLWRNASPLLAVVVIVALGFGYSAFLPSSILPALQTESKLSSQVAISRKGLIDARSTAAAPLDEIKMRVTNAQATVAAKADSLLADTEVIPSVDALYGYAEQSGVTLTDLQSEAPGMTDPINAMNGLGTPIANVQPTKPAPTATPTPIPSGTPNPTVLAPATPTPSPTPQPDAYHFTTVRMKIRGGSHQLVDFVSRIKEAYAKSFIVSDIALVGDQTVATLTMRLWLYSSPFSSGNVIALTPPQLPPLSTLVPPTPRAVPTAVPTAYHMYLVEWGDTLLTIASRFQTTVQAIMDANGLADTRIYAGQQLSIPGASGDEVPISVATTGFSDNPLSPSGLPAQGPIDAVFHDPDYFKQFGRVHQGVDIGVNIGTPVHATMAGRIAYAATYDSWGNLVAIENGEWLVIFAHLSRIDVHQGDSVDVGQVVGLSGSTGNSSGPHVHYEVHDNGVPVNPPGQ